MYSTVEWGWGVSPQCENTAGVWDLGTEDLFSVLAAGLHIPELTLVPSEPPFPPLYIDVASKALLAPLAWLRVSCTLQILPELQDADQLPGWTAPMVFQEGRGSQFSASGQHLGWEDEALVDLRP